MTSNRRPGYFALCLLLALLAAGRIRAAVPEDMSGGLRWRLAGPFRGGWATSAEGIPDRPDTYFFGAAGGGVWKTDDAGNTWTCVFDGGLTGAIDSIAIAPSDPNVLYAGSGNVATRYDIASGDGIYASTDGGDTWRHAGLSDTRAIGKILVDPSNPRRVLVAALGHIFGPNSERGVYRSTDTGRSWSKTLFVNDDTGIVDLARDDVHPEVVFASAWQARNYPWLSYFQPAAGPASGVYKSTNGGESWARIAGGGWPAGNLGRIGLAVSGSRIYAAVDASSSSGNVTVLPAGSSSAAGLWRSDDAGSTWTHVSAERFLGSSYFGRITLDPRDRDTIYATGQSIRKSTDGGRTFALFKGSPGGDDYHSLWINPKKPDHMITASDQGAVVTVNGGATWSSWYNQPTAQVYHIETDDRFPYWIYSGQQDSGTIGIASRSDYGQITFRDWHPVGGDERDYDMPDPKDPEIIYGTGLGGRISRYDNRTGQVQEISPWPIMTYGRRPVGLKYRYTWITPLATGKAPPYPIYTAAQVLFRSTDQGTSWQVISPDLSRAEKNAAGCDGAVTLENAGPCGFGVIFTIALSSRDSGEIWIGTDDGLVRLTRDGGKTWTNVTPFGLPAWSKIATLDLSALSPGTCYAAVDAQRLDDFSPHVYRTRDYGRTWTEITEGLPRGEFVDVVRADSKAAGLLFAGTARGVFVSFDDGGAWHPLQRNLPTTWMRDLSIHGDDLIAGTQGRAIWVLDDISPLRQAAEASRSAGAFLFKPAPAVRWRANENRDTPLPAETPAGENPPEGAILDYLLPPGTNGPVVLSIREAGGKLVRRFSSDDRPEKIPARQYFTDMWMPRVESLSAAAGVHRFVWDLRQPRPPAASFEYSIAATKFNGTSAEPQGLMAMPGSYTVELSAGSRIERRELTVVMDPRVTATVADLAAQKELSDRVVALLSSDTRALAQISAVEKQISDRMSQHPSADLPISLHDVQGALTLVSGGLSTSVSRLAAIEGGLVAADRAPTQAQREVCAELEVHSRQALDKWKAIQEKEIPTWNAALARTGLFPIEVPAPGQAQVPDDDDGEDLP